MKKSLLIDNVISETLLTEPFKGKIKVSVPKVDVSNYEQVLVYDVPVALPFWYQFLSTKGFSFRYHIVVYFDSSLVKNNLIVSHVGVLYALRGKKALINKVRIPHKYCKFCGKTLKDWGGKKHLMHPQGTMISDVWKHLNLKSNDIIGKRIPFSLKENLLRVFGEFDTAIAKKEVINIPTERNISLSDLLSRKLKQQEVNQLIKGDATEVLETLPNNSIDMIFIDPPYNLKKNYDSYKDERDDYVSWSLKWLDKCFKVLKPHGSLFLLNIPKWIYEILPNLLEKYYLQRWIVWDNQAEPKGKLIPAHYPLIWLSKTKDVKTYPLGEEQDDLRFCLRASCRKKREKVGIKDKIQVRDVRWDIHRVKHSCKRFEHPTQLPPKLLSFIIRLTTREGDIVLDPMMGVGTTPLVAKELGRRYIGIDISETYTHIARQRIEEKLSPDSLKQSIKIKQKDLSKKDLQIKIGELALQKGRIPTVDEFCNEYGYKKEEIMKAFHSWSKATKYAKLLLEEKQGAETCALKTSKDLSI